MSNCCVRGIWLVIAIGLLGTAGTGWAQPPAAATPAPTSQRISLDLKGVDILDVLKLFSQKSGLNFVAGRNVTGRVTIFVKDVDVWEAFEMIVGANDLAYELQGDIVSVMTGRDYELLYGEKFQERKRSLVVPLRYAKVVQVATVLNQVKSAVGRVVADEATNTLILSDVQTRLDEMQAMLKQLDRPTETRVYSLSYAEAEKLKEKVQELLSPVGTFTFDARTNKAVVSDLAEIIPRVDRMVHAFDVPDGQVLIEAKIVKVDLTDQMDLGIDWKQLISGDLESRTNFRVLSDIIGSTATGGALKLVTASSGSKDDKTQILIEALKKMTHTETLANPRIMVANNQEAKILVGKKEAFVTTTTTVPATGSTVTSPEIQFVDVGTKLYVTPNVKRDGYIQLKIRPEVSSSEVKEFQSNRIPIVTSTEAETNVLVKSGATLIIGGLIETKSESTESRVPGLASLPIIGRAFKGTTDKKTKSEIVVFLQPQIIMPDGGSFVFPPVTEEPVPDAVPSVLIQDPVPASYREAVRRRLQEILAKQFRGASLPAGSVTVLFVLRYDGALVRVADVTSPQGERFILAAREALTRAELFPRFPDESPANEVRFRVAVEYNP